MGLIGKITFVLIMFSGLSQTFADGPVHSRELSGSLSAGIAQFNTLSPSTDIQLNKGTAASLQGEKPIGEFGLYLEAMVNYMHTTGTSNYNFAGTSVTYIQNNVNFSLDDIQVGLGLRLKILENSAIRPYVEGGLTGGYFQLSYDNSLKTPAVVSLGSDYRTYDGVLASSFYGEGGIEFDLSHSFGVRLADHYTEVVTRPLDTLKKQTVRYDVNTYLLALYTHF